MRRTLGGMVIVTQGVLGWTADAAISPDNWPAYH